jgi:acyl carrier protein
MNFENFTEEFAGAIEISKEILTNDFNMANDAAWDSLAFITTMALVDTYFNIVIDAETLSKINTFGELKELISKQAA